MKIKKYIGIDGGASKILVQEILVSNKENLAFYGDYKNEVFYNDFTGWDKQFKPLPAKKQQLFSKKKNIELSDSEKNQGVVILKAIKYCYEQAKKNLNGISGAGFCFPGVKTKTKEGTIIMKNGPRIPELCKELISRGIPINRIFNDSDCCVLGELHGEFGKLRNISNAIYIGGGTGIADGIILNNKILDLNGPNTPLKSWELILSSDLSVEDCLSPGMITKRFNSLQEKNPISSLEEVINYAEEGHKIANQLLKSALDALELLVEEREKYIFKKTGKSLLNIVIGQRLALALCLRNEKNIFMEKIKSTFCDDLNFSLSLDRRTAALGAAWSRSCL